jgi:retron-type reverse transcriptase
MAASLRNRRLARRLAEERGDEALAAAMPALRRELAGRTRRIAAAELALLLGWRHAVVLAFLATRPCAPNDAPGTRFDGLYRSWEIPKRRGGKRRITAPVPVLKAIQRRLLDAVLAATPCHPAATGFLPGISIADNARPHVGRKVVVNVDIEGFFPNTRFKLVRRAVERILPRRLSPEARRLVVDICTMGGGLPIGAPTSPAIANHVMLPVDRALAKVAARHGVAYTRYADDLTLSGDDPARLLPFLRQVVGQLGYRLDPKKTNFFRRGRRQVVTGLVVNDKVSVPRKLRRRLRAAVHRVATQGAAAELEWHGRPMHAGELAGRIAFAGVAHPDESRALAARLREGLARKRRGGKAGGGAR